MGRARLSHGAGLSLAHVRITMKRERKTGLPVVRVAYLCTKLNVKCQLPPTLPGQMAASNVCPHFSKLTTEAQENPRLYQRRTASEQLICHSFTHSFIHSLIHSFDQPTHSCALQLFSEHPPCVAAGAGEAAGNKTQSRPHGARSPVGKTITQIQTKQRKEGTFFFF